MKIDTQVIHGGNPVDPQTGATVYPIYQSAGFYHETAESLADTFAGKQFGYMYSRISNPTVVALEKRLNALEGGVGAVCVASGMAATSTTLFAICRAGDHIISGKSLFGGTYYALKGLFRDMGVEVTFVDSADMKAYEEAIQENTVAIFFETLGNPKLDVPDVARLSAIAKAAKVPLIADSTITTPCLSDLKSAGVDVAVYATTKYVAGHGTTVGGAIVDFGNYKWKDSRSHTIQESVKAMGSEMAFLARCKKVRSNTGCNMPPFNAYMTGVGLDTMALRVDRHCSNALKLATFLNEHPKVTVTNYPGLPNSPYHELAKQQFANRFGPLVTIRVGSQARAFEVINRLKLAKNLVNLGDTRTLIVHPLSTIYQSYSQQEAEDAGVFDDLIRIAVGIENPEDLINDFNQALN